MAFFDKKHFEGKIQIAGVDIFAVLKSQIYRDWDSEQNIPWESWHYHLCLSNEARDKAQSEGIDTSSENAKTLVIMGKAKEAVEVCSMKVEKKTTPKRKKPSTPIKKESEE